MFIDLTYIGLQGVHFQTFDYEQAFIIQNEYLQQVIIINLN